MKTKYTNELETKIFDTFHSTKYFYKLILGILRQVLHQNYVLTQWHSPICNKKYCKYSMVYLELSPKMHYFFSKQLLKLKSFELQEDNQFQNRTTSESNQSVQTKNWTIFCNILTPVTTETSIISLWKFKILFWQDVNYHVFIQTYHFWKVFHLLFAQPSVAIGYFSGGHWRRVHYIIEKKYRKCFQLFCTQFTLLKPSLSFPCMQCF